MSNLTRFAILGGTLLCAFAADSQAAPWGIVAGENMVMLPVEIPVPQAPAAQTAPAIYDADTMVVVPQQQAAVAAASTPAPVIGSGYAEAGANSYAVSNNVGDWFGQFANGQVQVTEKDRLSAQVLHQKAFHDKGVFVGVGNNHTFDDKWSTDVSAGMGSGASFLPRYRADAALNRRWLEKGNLVTTVGTTWTRATQTYSSIGLFLGANYYTNSPWILQAGIRTDRSSPGGVYGTSGYTGVTYGYNKRYLLSGRVGYGREAYQLLGVNSITNAFNSHTFGLNWRQWVGQTWGFNVGGEYYKNPSYDRTGGTFSLFKEF